MAMKTLVVITGGTFVSIINENGLSAREGFSQFDVLESIANSNFSSIELTFSQPFSKLSENIVPSDWTHIFSDLIERKGSYDNVLIVHGTDTMAYSAAALSFLNALHLNETIVVTGANIPLSADNSDAKVNFIQALAALKYFNEQRIKGCFIVFNGENNLDRAAMIHSGSRVKKDKWDDYCYRSFYIGKQFLGEVKEGVKTIDFDKNQYGQLLANSTKFDLKTFNFSSEGVAAIKIYPGLQPSSLPTPDNGNVKYILLEVYNSGTAPGDESEFSLVPWIQKVIGQGAVVFAISQHEGKVGVTMDIYESSTALLKAGIIPLGDLIWEAAIPKLMLAAANFNKPNDVIEFMQANIAGEKIS